MKDVRHPYCPVCHQGPAEIWSRARDFEYFSTENEYVYFNCRECGTIFTPPLPTDQLKVIYPANYYSYVPGNKSWVFRIKEWLDLRLFRKTLMQLNGESLNILDAGGGTGWILDALKKSDKRIKLTQIVDIDEKAGVVALEKGHAYFEGRIEDFESENRFDLILMLNLIEHVADPEEMLRKVLTLLTPGGIVLLKTPQTRSLDARLFRNSYWGGLHCPRHWTIFSEESIRIVIERAGFKVDRLRYTQGGPFWAFSLIIFMARKKWLNTSKARPVIFHPLFPVLSALFAAFDFFRSLFSRTSQIFISIKSK